MYNPIPDGLFITCNFIDTGCQVQTVEPQSSFSPLTFFWEKQNRIFTEPFWVYLKYCYSTGDVKFYQRGRFSRREEAS